MPKRAPRRVEFRVSFVLPEGARVRDAQGYVRDAVGVWHGSLRPFGAYGDDDPGDPMRYLDGDTVRVVRPKAVRRRT